MPVKKLIEITVTAQFEIELNEDLQAPDAVDQWKEGLWHIDGLQDVYKHAALMALKGYGGYCTDGLGHLMESNMKGVNPERDKGSTFFNEISCNVDDCTIANIEG